MTSFLDDDRENDRNEHSFRQSDCLLVRLCLEKERVVVVVKHDDPLHTKIAEMKVVTICYYLMMNLIVILGSNPYVLA